MALRAVPEHPKFLDLKLRLGLKKGFCLGMLEAMWHFCGKFTPRGDIGKYTDVVIESWIEWDGEPGALIRAMVDSGWIDRDARFRLLVHDWPEHADKTTKQALRRMKAGFCLPSTQNEALSGLYPEREYSECFKVAPPEPVPEPEPVPAAAAAAAQRQEEKQQQQPKKSRQRQQPEEPRQQPLFPETARVVQELHPGADVALKLAAAAAEIRPGITDGELSRALVTTHRGKRQQSAGLWLKTVPEYLRGLPAQARDGPGAIQAEPELSAEELRTRIAEVDVWLADEFCTPDPESAGAQGWRKLRQNYAARLEALESGAGANAAGVDASGRKPPGSELNAPEGKTRRGGAT